MTLKLSGLRVLPRWVIFLIDISCVLTAVIVAFLLRFNFDLPRIAAYNWLYIFGCVVAVNTLSFCIFRSFAGIIRHTGLQDAWRILIALMFSFSLYVAINIVDALSGTPFFLPYSVIIIAFLSAFAFMFLYRIAVKICFDSIVNGTHRSNVLVYGAGYAGTITRNVLQSQGKEEDAKRVCGFIEDNAYTWGTQLDGIHVYRAVPFVLDKLLKKFRFSQVIITDSIVNSPNKDRVIDWCLQHKIKVQQIPPIAQWMQTGLKKRQIKDIRIEDLLNRNVITMDDASLSRELSGKVILITGAAGSIGSELARQVSAVSPARVILCDQAESPLHDLFLELKESFPQLHFHPFLGDICNKKHMEHLYAHYRPQIVFHAAAYKHVPVMERAPDMAILNNVLGTMNMAELAVAYDVDKFVMISTDKAVNPTNVMGASKRVAEIFTQSLNNYLHQNMQLNGQVLDHQPLKPTVFITTRFGNVLGSNGSVVPWFKKLIERGGPVTVTDPEVTRYFMTISEACQLVLQAGVMGRGGEIFAFDMGTPVKIADLAEKMIRLSGLEPGKDIEIVYTGLRPGEKLYEEVLAKREEVVPTYHEKIMIAKVRAYDYEEVKRQIQTLIHTARQGNAWEVVQLMKTIIPEYKSNNSRFEKLDIPDHEPQISILPTS